jgi:hypothetical protein
VLAAHFSEMRRQVRLYGLGQHGSTILLPFTTPDHDLIAVEVEVLHAQLQRLLQSEPRPVKQRDDDARDTRQLIQDGTNLIDTEHYRDPHRAVCMRHVLDSSGLKAKDLTIEKQQRAERLVLCRRADLRFNRKVREVPIYLVTAHLRRMPLTVIDNEQPYPRDVGFFGPAAVVTKTDGCADPIEQLWLS